MRRFSDFSIRRRKYTALEPDEIFIDSQNLPSYDTAHLEGRIERALPSSVYRALLAVCAVVLVLVVGQTWYLSVWQGDFYAGWSQDNRLNQESIVAERGLITDRSGVSLAVNTTNATSTGTTVTRTYPLGEATAHVVGYVSYPKRDSSGNWYQDETMGLSGVEALYNDTLRGVNGLKIQETNARGEVVSGSVVRVPRAGRDVTLSLDAELQRAVHGYLTERVEASYIGGAVAIMDIHTGELVTLASYPSYDPEILSLGIPQKTVAAYLADPRSPFVDRGVTGLYTPGSIVKPFVALAALTENIVTPQKTFVSTGKLVLPNPYDPQKPSVFKDWKAHGVVDMRRAIAVSSDVYFYIIGGGFESQRGLGISAIDEYALRFGFGKKTGFPLEEEPAGTVPTPEWKAETFNEPVWRVGDTYNTSIGQYGWQVTLLQSVRAVAALANGGTLVTPTILLGERTPTENLNLDPTELRVVQEGMRQAVTDGTAQSLLVPGVTVAAKTGTAETGARKEYTNSLVIGYFPYEKPQYAFAAILERAHAGTVIGAPAVMRNVLEWMALYRDQMVSPRPD